MRRSPPTGRTPASRPSSEGTPVPLAYEEVLESWDPMFSRSIDPTRRDRTEAILRAIGERVRSPFRALELGSGPGSLVARMLRRFPRCRVVAVDTDPVLLEVGERALRRFRRRTAWILADLREATWPSALPPGRFDVAVSSLTLHWLEADTLRRLYRELGRILRPGGLVIDGDFLPSRRPADRAVGPPPTTGRPEGAARRGGGLPEFQRSWEAWWVTLSSDPTLRAAFRDRQERLPGRIPPTREPGPRAVASLELHEHALLDAGFARTEVLWRAGAFRVLAAVR